MLTATSDIDTKILDDWQAALVYVTHKDDMALLDVVEQLQAEVGEFMNVAIFVAEDVDAMGPELKKEFKSTRLP